MKATIKIIGKINIEQVRIFFAKEQKEFWKRIQTDNGELTKVNETFRLKYIT